MRQILYPLGASRYFCLTFVSYMVLITSHVKTQNLLSCKADLELHLTFRFGGKGVSRNPVGFVFCTSTWFLRCKTHMIVRISHFVEFELAKHCFLPDRKIQMCQSKKQSYHLLNHSYSTSTTTALSNAENKFLNSNSGFSVEKLTQMIEVRYIVYLTPPELSVRGLHFVAPNAEFSSNFVVMFYLSLFVKFFHQALIFIDFRHVNLIQHISSTDVSNNSPPMLDQIPSSKNQKRAAF